MHVMLDFETLSLSNANPAILTIGAVKFDPYAHTWAPSIAEFYVRVDYRTAIQDYGLDVNEATRRWWADQEENVRYEALYHPDRLSYSDAFRQLASFCCEVDGIWSHGVGYDVSIADHAFARLGIETPWSYRQKFDTRTVQELAEKLTQWFPTPSPRTDAHHALADCKFQVKNVQTAITRLALGGPARQ